jgi:competence protein ComEC
VLLIEYDGQRILLPGDIESSAEWALLRGDELPGNLTLLLAAHHGSRSSSNPAFVTYTQPEWVVYSTGYKNQHGHPHPLVQERFDAQDSRSLNTAIQGAILFRWWPGQHLQISATRQQQRRYWYEPIAPVNVLP